MSQPDTFTSDAAEINAAVASLDFLAISKENDLNLAQTWIDIVRQSGLIPREGRNRGGKYYQVHMEDLRLRREDLKQVLTKYGVMELIDDKVEWRIRTHSVYDKKPLPQHWIRPDTMISRITLHQLLELLKSGHPTTLTRADIIERELEKARARVKELESLFSQEFKSLRASVKVR